MFEIFRQLEASGEELIVTDQGKPVLKYDIYFLQLGATMDAWGTGVFENDDAEGWVDELEKYHDDSFILDTLLAVNQNLGYLKLPEASCGLASAEIVASAFGEMNPELPDEVQDWIQTNSLTANPELPSIALRAVLRIKANSELKELWDEAEDKEEWYQTLIDLENRLGAFV